MKIATYLGPGEWEAWVTDRRVPVHVAWDADKLDDHTIWVWRKTKPEAKRLVKIRNFEIVVTWQPPRDDRGILHSDSEFIHRLCSVCVLDDTLRPTEDPNTKHPDANAVRCQILRSENVRGVRKHKER